MVKITSFFQKLWEQLKQLGLKIREELRRDTGSGIGLVKLALLCVLVVCLLVLLVVTRQTARQQREQSATLSAVTEQTDKNAGPSRKNETETQSAMAEISSSTPAPTATPAPEFSPAGDSSRILSTLLQIDGSYVDNYSAAAEDKIDFAGGDAYSAVDGITTFRGSNFRDNAQLGLADMPEQSFGGYWYFQTEGTVSAGGESLSGSGYTGQPLAVRWSEQDKENMDLYEWALEKEGLTEIIYPSLDGHIYFLDMETGSPTREAFALPVSFSSGGTLDPRGYPILYIGGSTVTAAGEEPAIMIISLLDGSVLYSIGANDDFSVHWNAAFNAAPLVDAQSDRLIFPGENGVLYILKLNAEYDGENGDVSVSPEQVIEWKYTAAEAHGYGVSASPAAWRGHLIMADRGGNLLCLDLNSLQIDWCIDSLDLTRCSPVLQVDDSGHPYIYLSTSLHYGYRAYYRNTVPVWKIDAETGEIVWQRDFSCYTEDGMDGGVMGTVAPGSGSLENILYVSVARSPEQETGTLYALDSQTGEELWHFESGYGYASPTCFYDSNGRGYVVQISREEGNVYLLDGLTGQLYDEYDFGSTMESSPIICDNFLITGSSDYYLFGIELK